MRRRAVRRSVVSFVMGLVGGSGLATAGLLTAAPTLMTTQTAQARELPAVARSTAAIPQFAAAEGSPAAWDERFAAVAAADFTPTAEMHAASALPMGADVLPTGLNATELGVASLAALGLLSLAARGRKRQTA